MDHHFEYVTPTSWEEAAAALEDDACAVLAGGTDLITRIDAGLDKEPRRLVSLRCVLSNGAIAEGEDGLAFGAKALLDEVIRSDAVAGRFVGLIEACAHIGGPQTRNRGTLVGNLCSASSAADACGISLCFDAQLRVQTASGLRELPLSELFVGPRQTSLGPGELVKEVVFPNPPDRTGSAYRRVGTRRVCDCATVIAAAVISLDESGAVARAALGLGSVAPTPIRAAAAEAVLLGKPFEDDLAAEAAALAAEATAPISDIRGSADYRREVVKSIVPAVLKTAHCRAQGNCA